MICSSVGAIRGERGKGRVTHCRQLTSYGTQVQLQIRTTSQHTGMTAVPSQVFSTVAGAESSEQANSTGFDLSPKHTDVIGCYTSPFLSPWRLHGHPAHPFAGVGSVGRLAGAGRTASSYTCRVGLTSAALQVSPRLESGKAGRVRSVRLLLVDRPSALRAPGKQCSEKAAPRALVSERQGGQEPWASRFHPTEQEKVSRHDVVCRHRLGGPLP
jgi:hypothetical protein